MVRAQAANMGSSPPSSTDATHCGTPSTNITAMSPETYIPANGNTVVPRFGLRVNTQPAKVNYGTTSFTNLSLPESGSAQLSPTAEEFTPRTATFANVHVAAPVGQGISAVNNLVAGSMPDVRSNTRLTAHGAVGQASNSTMCKDMESNVRISPNLQVVWQTFSTDENVTRTFQINNTYNVVSLIHVFGRFSVQFKTLAYFDQKSVDSGIVRFGFNDDREAKQAYVLVASLFRPLCQLAQLTAKEVAVAHGKDPSVVTDYEGQLLVSLLYNPYSPMPTINEFGKKLAKYGAVKAVASVNPIAMNSITFRVEFHDVRAAQIALNQLKEASNENITFLATAYEPDVRRHAAVAVSSPSSGGSRDAQPSLTGRTTVPSGDFARLGNVMARVLREASGPPRGASAAARNGHNVVEVGRIEQGLDVRTTIMLRNIPNRVDQATLKAFLDETSFGEFDFMYLRIDFANNCNVGYAFVNFVDPLAIIAFARARAGQRWNIFSSDKVAEISYATIQGRDCLIQKFRNSSVMLEHPSFCPKLYYTRPSQRAGQEEIFPDPDNYSKMRRSIDNAEHVGLYNRRAQAATLARATYKSPFSIGLFAPREGQAHREEQRRRRSQFDRGTPGAEIELSSYRLTDAALENSRMAGARLAKAFHGLSL